MCYPIDAPPVAADAMSDDNSMDVMPFEDGIQMPAFKTDDDMPALEAPMRMNMEELIQGGATAYVARIGGVQAADPAVHFPDNVLDFVRRSQSWTMTNVSRDEFMGSQEDLQRSLLMLEMRDLELPTTASLIVDVEERPVTGPFYEEID